VLFRFNRFAALWTFREEPTLVLNENVTVWYLLTTERTAAEWGSLNGHRGDREPERVTITDSLIYNLTFDRLKGSPTGVKVELSILSNTL
jgi:hypothetical protein